MARRLRRSPRQIDGWTTDLELLVRVHETLMTALSRIRSSTELSAAQRGRWQRRLQSISDVARTDLRAAERELARFAAQWRAMTGLPAATGAPPPPTTAGRVGDEAGSEADERE